MRKIYSLDSLNEIRAVLRKSTMQTAIYKKQAEAGSRQTNELLAYIGFMSEDECMAFLNSVREAPFIPNINLMWTQQVIEYLMLSDEQYRRKGCFWTSARQAVEGYSESEELSYSTKHVQRHVDKAYWHMLPKGWSAKYYRPSQVLKIAVKSDGASDFCKYIAEKLFIKAADLEDCLSPVTKIPPVLPTLPKQEKSKSKNEIVLKDFPEGTHIAIDVPKLDQPLAPKVIEIPKIDEVPKQRRNPVVATTPMFAAESKRCPHPTREQSKEIDAIIMARYAGFGGTDSARQLSDLIGLKREAIWNRVCKIRARNSQVVVTSTN